jgi:polar amino acid transport system substrate-binding protein
LDPHYQTWMLNRIQIMIIEPFAYPTLKERAICRVSNIIKFKNPSVPHGLIMSNKVLQQTEQEKWRAIANDMRADGTVGRIMGKYFKPALAAKRIPKNCSLS